MRSSSWADLLPAALDAVAEAAWIAAVYLLVEIAWGRGEFLFGIPQLAVVVAAGIALGFVLRQRAATHATPSSRGPGGRIGPVDSIADAGRRDVLVAAAAVLLAALAGWAVAPDVRAALGALDVALALNLHAGGWLLGLALLRGIAHGNQVDEERDAARSLRVGVAVLVGVWVVGRGVGGPDRALFQDNAITDTVVLMTAGLLGVGVTGMRALARRGGASQAAGRVPDLDWQRNRDWLLLLVTVVAGMILLALPAISVAGRGVVESGIAILWIALELVVLVVVLRAIPRAVTMSIPFLLGGLIVVVVLRFIGFRPEALAQLLGQVRDAVQFARPQAPDRGPGDAVTILGAALVIAAVVGVILLVRAWLRRRIPAEGGDVFEERSVVVEPGAIRLPRPGLPRRGRRRAMPVDAVTAYRSMLEQLDLDPDLRRAAGESPAEHAARLVEWTPGARSVGRLAVDYELARFGGRSLTAREEARALARWQDVQVALRRRPKSARAGGEDEFEARARRRTARQHRDEEQRPFGT